MKAEIISIGNELLSGKTVNTNATYMAQKLVEIGVAVGWVQTIADSAEAIREALDIAMKRADVILITGGLGPTHDDITKKVIAEYFGSKLVMNQEILRDVEAKFRRRGIPMPEINREQALVPDKAELMPNPVGTAPGMIFRRDGKLVFVMPGVPREMKAMMEGSVLPRLQTECEACRIRVNLFRTTGIPESVIYEKIESELKRFASYEIAFLPRYTGVDIRVIRKGNDISDQAKFEDFQAMLEKHIGSYIYTTDHRELEEVVGALLKERNWTISVAESLTGGLVQDKITNVSGSSAYFMGGIVAYSNEAKMQFLQVREDSLKQFGAVSDVVAREMASGVRQAFGTTIAVSTTGIAGPTGATPTKPIGLMYVGLATQERVVARKFQFGTDRLINKQRSAQAALEMVRRAILGLPLEE